MPSVVSVLFVFARPQLSCVVVMVMVCHSISRTWRLAAYRQFTWWVYGVLGKKNRRVIPACVVNTIRREFPEESGHYEGFKAPELDLN